MRLVNDGIPNNVQSVHLQVQYTLGHGIVAIKIFAVAPVPATGPVFLRLESQQRDSNKILTDPDDTRYSRLLRLSRLTRTLLKGQQVLGGTTVTDGAL